MAHDKPCCGCGCGCGSQNDALQAMTLTIEGMSCSHCAAAVTKALQALPFVSEVEVDLDAKTAVITGEAMDTDALCKAVEDAGYSPRL